MRFKFVLIGAGIAGVTCAENLSRLCPRSEILIVSSSELLKGVCNIKKLSKTLEEFSVIESPLESVTFTSPNIKTLRAKVIAVDDRLSRVGILKEKEDLIEASGSDNLEWIDYEYLCICTGAKPSLVVKDNPHHVIGIRDTETVENLKERLKTARRVLVVGNGGIALELVQEISHCQVVWAIKDNHIGNAFFDKDAAEFLLPQLYLSTQPQTTETNEKGKNVETSKHPIPQPKLLYHRSKYTDVGTSIGPDWYLKIGSEKSSAMLPPIIEYGVTIKEIFTHEQRPLEFASGAGEVWPVYISLTNGKIYGCDFVVSATGVIPNVDIFPQGKKESDGGLWVDKNMKTSVKNIFAAGDCCTITWADSPHWFQMRLWSQARTQGRYVALCLAAQDSGGHLDELQIGFDFELFAHATRFFGYRVVMLGLYNGQGLNEKDFTVYVKKEAGKGYKKIIIGESGRMEGALLIGDTQLEETFENLILNQLNVQIFGEELLEDNVDVEDYFD